MNGIPPVPENGGNGATGSPQEGTNKMPPSPGIVSPYPWLYMPGEHTMMYGFIRSEPKRMPLIISDMTLEEWIEKYERYNRRH